MSGGGVIKESRHKKYIHVFTLSCDAANAHNQLLISWRNGWKFNLFHLSDLDSVMCSDKPLIDEGHPEAGFDTIEGSGSGYLNGKPATIRFRLSDAGEPGRNDRVEYSITGEGGAHVSGTLDGGNHQAHRDF